MPKPPWLRRRALPASDNARMVKLRHCLLVLGLLLASPWASAQRAPTALPDTVLAALREASIPPEALSVVLARTHASQPVLISHQAERAMQPASVIKLVTTFAALDLLGPGFTWRTPVWLDGAIEGESLKGNLVIQGQGDPALVIERLWLLLRRVQGLGVRRIEGDAVVDSSAFATAAKDPGAFDGEPLRPYNAAPDALLINFRAITLTFTPDAKAGVARVQMNPPLWGVRVPSTVPLAVGSASICSDYRAGLRADFSDPSRISLNGAFDAACGEKTWPVAYPQPETYNARALEGLWRSMGGDLTGKVRSGVAPQQSPSFVVDSPTLGEVVRDINKFSNNVMAQQLFLTLGRLPLEAQGKAGQKSPITKPAGDWSAWPSATFERSRERVNNWWKARLPGVNAPYVDNGSGLSRQTQISAQALADLLVKAYGSPYMPELMASLPVAGVDGTLRRSKTATASAHLKTGSLRGVVSLAGYVHTEKGENLVLVAIVNHERAQAARGALEALVQWAARRP